MAESSESTDWIIKGAKVVVLTGDDGTGTASIRPAFIEKVNKKTFTLHGNDAKYDIADQREQAQGAWSRGSRVVSPDDPRVERVRERIAMSHAKSALHSAYEQLRRDVTRDGLAELVQAAQALDTLLERRAIANR